MELVNIPREFSSRYINDGFSGGEKKRMEVLQLAMLRPRIAVLPTPRRANGCAAGAMRS